jgi:hypothetical protein
LVIVLFGIQPPAQQIDIDPDDRRYRTVPGSKYRYLKRTLIDPIIARHDISMSITRKPLEDLSALCSPRGTGPGWGRLLVSSIITSPSTIAVFTGSCNRAVGSALPNRCVQSSPRRV